MVSISKRLRGLTYTPAAQPEPDDLERFRKHTREVLNRPYQYEPVVQQESEGPMPVSSDPFEGIFKPFSKIAAVPLATALPRGEGLTRDVNWRGMGVALAALLLIVGGYFLYQFVAGLYSGTKIISPSPNQAHGSNPASSSANASTNSSSPKVSVPSNTALQPGGPYTVPSSSQNASSLGQGGSTTPIGNVGGQPATVVPPGGSSGGTGGSGGGTPPSGGGGGTPPPAPTCPSGKVCTGTDATGQPCTTSSPCTPVTVAGVVVTVSDFLSSKTPPCPCILIH